MKRAPFEKGNTVGVGHGRPKMGYVTRCKKFAEDEAWEILEAWARQRRNAKASIAAIQVVLAYGYGKPREQLVIESNVPITIQQLFLKLRHTGFNGMESDAGRSDNRDALVEDAREIRPEMVCERNPKLTPLVAQTAGDGIECQGSPAHNG